MARTAKNSADTRSAETNALDEVQHKPPVDDKTNNNNNDGDNNNDDEQQTDAQTRRPRRQSDTERQNNLEHQREVSRTERTRTSLTNNRFLSTKQAAPKAHSNPEHGDTVVDADNQTKTKSTTTTKRKQQDDGKNDANDSDEDDSAALLLPAGLTIVTKKRSSVIQSAAAGTTTDTSCHRSAIAYPHVHLVPSIALRRSKWTQELEDQADCGLFVDDKRAHLRSIHPSTLVRLEERLRREEAARQDEDERAGTVDSSLSRPVLQLTDLIHTRKPHTRTQSSSISSDVYRDNERAFVDTFKGNEVAKTSVTTQSRARSQSRGASSSMRAMLEICVDRIVLDDHEMFALDDRISAQLRVLYAIYGQLLQQQPWQLHLDRIRVFVDAFVDQASSKASAASIGQESVDSERAILWQAQIVSDAEVALNELGRLQQLHQQLLVKLNELQECCRQSSEANALPYRVHTILRSDSIDLGVVQALVEILANRVATATESSLQTLSGANVSQATVAHLTARLEALEVHDKCLRQVLRLERQYHDGPNARTGRRLSPPGVYCSLLPARRRKFYVAIFVNGKQAFVTSARCASGDDSQCPRGLVLLNETFRLKVPYFPESLAAKVFEQGIVCDTALSTAAVSLILPGQTEQRDSSDFGGSAAAHRIPVASLAPSCEWYQFSSTRAIARTKWHSSFLNSSLYVNFTRHPHGRVHVTTSWVAPVTSSSNPINCINSARGDGQRSSGTPAQPHDVDAWMCCLPPQRPPLARALLKNDSAQLIGSSTARRATRHSRDVIHKSGFSYERDFLVHIKALDRVLDPNDPDNAAAMRLQQHVKAQSQLLAARDVFRTSSLAFGHSELLIGSASALATSTKLLTKRNALLQLRDREHAAKHGTSTCDAVACRSATISSRGAIEPSRWDHDVFEDPVPLDEREIAANEKYLALLRPEIKAFDRRLRCDEVDEADLHSVERHQQLSRLKIHDFVERVKQHQLVTKRSANAAAVKDKTKTLASIIQEQPLPLFPGTLDLSGLAGLFAPRRRLRPQATKRRAPTALAEWPTACDLYIQVQKATNVPVRMTQSARPALTSSKRDTSKRSSVIGDSTSSAGGGDNNVSADSQALNHAAKPSLQYESHVFVEICFQGKKRRTTCSLVSSNSSSSSANPVWMETLVVPFRPPLDDWSPESIQRCRDDIRVNLFDQVVVAGDDDSERLETAIDPSGTGAQQRSFHQDNYFLGSLCIPFTTLYHTSGSLEATLRCDMPVEHLGYVNLKSADDDASTSSINGIETPRSFADDDDETPRQRPARTATTSAVAADERIDGGVRTSSREATFVSLMMTLDPLLPLPVKLFVASITSIGLGGDNDPRSDAHKRLVQYANDWAAKTRSLNAATKRRRYDVFVHTLQHGNAFLSQFIGAQQPPRTPAFARSAVTLQRLVRFVTLVPFLDDWHLFDGDKDVWSTSQEFLGINAGDYEEHAVLLCNFFHWLDRKDANMRTYLVLGRAVPEGDSVYVLRQDVYKIPHRSVLWNASKGVGYHVWDERCPMQDVSLVVSRDNVFANVQQPLRGFQDLVWDIEGLPKAWKPFFTAATGLKDAFALPSVQVRDLSYTDTPSAYVRRVESELIETLKREIRRWRSGRATTSFNMDASMKLRTYLEELEQRMQGGGDGGNSSDPHVLQDLLAVKDVSGLPLHTTFTDVDKVVELVKNTNIHWNERAGVEFALAVFVYDFPNCVLSVWIYFAALQRH